MVGGQENGDYLPGRFAGHFSHAQPHEVAEPRQPHHVPVVHEQQNFVEAPPFVPVHALFVERGPQFAKHRVLNIPFIPHRDQLEHVDQLLVGDVGQHSHQPFAERPEHGVDQSVPVAGRGVRANRSEIVAHVVGGPRPEVLGDQLVELRVRDGGPVSPARRRVIRIDDRVAVRRVVHHHVVRVPILRV